MSIDNHMAALQQKHQNLENEIREVMAQPSSDTSQVAWLKRRKLRLKDEMTELERQTQH